MIYLVRVVVYLVKLILQSAWGGAVASRAFDNDITNYAQTGNV